MATATPTADDRLRGEIRAEMARQKMRRDDLAEALGLTTSALDRRLSGATPITFAESERFAAALGLTFADLLRRTAGEAA